MSVAGRVSGCSSLSCCSESAPSGDDDRLTASALTGSTGVEDVDERKFSDDVSSSS